MGYTTYAIKMMLIFWLPLKNKFIIATIITTSKKLEISASFMTVFPVSKVITFFILWNI